MNKTSWGMVAASAALLALGLSWGVEAPQSSMTFFITSVGSWNSSDPSRGCSQDNLRSSGGAGMLYCFAVK